MNPFRIVIAVLALAGAAGTFLPWVSAPFVGSFDGTAGNAPGWITSGLFVVSAVLALATGPKRPLTALFAGLCAAPALAGGAYALYQMLDLQRTVKAIAGDNALAQALLGSASVEIGLYLVVGMGVLVPVASAVAFALNRPKARPVQPGQPAA
jgi:hypothetical protein